MRYRLLYAWHLRGRGKIKKIKDIVDTNISFLRISEFYRSNKNHEKNFQAAGFYATLVLREYNFMRAASEGPRKNIKIIKSMHHS